MANIPILKQSLMGVEALKETIRKAKRSFLSKEEVNSYYTIKESIGSGYFATVYRAVEKKTGAEVAIKCIDKSKTGGKEEMLEEEVAILQKVRHPNCVSMIEIFESPKHVYLVVELVTGGELFSRIIAKKTFCEADASRIVGELCEGLKYLHSLGIVHRDLKPENILLSDRGEDATIKITDFGLSKIMKKKKGFLHSRCGTPAYAAPELIEGNPYDSKVDMWAVGCILYILLSGCPPFWGSNNNELFNRICSGVYPMDTPQWENISPRAKSLVRALLCMNPSERLSAAQALEHPFVVGDRKALSSRRLQSWSQMLQFVQEKEEKEKAASKAASKDKASEAAPSDAVLISMETEQPDDLDARMMSTSIEEEEAEIALLSAPVTKDALLRMDAKYSEWPSYAKEFEAGNLLGTARLNMIKEAMQKPSTWKERALDAGYIRPFLLLVSMHPRQRMSYASLVKVDITQAVWYGDPHREAWEIISNNIEGLKAKTTKKVGSAPTWWDTLVQVSDATLSHFWSQDKLSKKAMSNRPHLTSSQLKEAIGNSGDKRVAGLEELFLDTALKKLMMMQAKKNPGDMLPIKYLHKADLDNIEDPKAKDLVSKMLFNFNLKPIVLKMINWFVAEGYMRSKDNALFMGWVEKERVLTLSSVFLGKGHSRVLFPLIFAILLQRLFLSMYGIYVEDFWPTEDQSLLRGSGMRSSSSSSSTMSPRNSTG